MKYGFWGAAFFIFPVLLVVIFGTVFRVGEVHCLETGTEAGRKVCDRLKDQVRGRSLIFFDFENDELVQRALLDETTQERFYIESVKKILPQTLEYRFRSQPPLSRLKIGEESWLIGREGSLRPDDQRPGLTEISTTERSIFYQEDGSLDERHILFFVELINALQELELGGEAIVVDSIERIVVYTQQYPDVILDFSQSGGTQAQRMKQIFSTIFEKENELGIREIDLRFELPVMRTFHQPPVEIDLSQEESESQTEKNENEEATGSAKILIDSPEESLL